MRFAFIFPKTSKVPLKNRGMRRDSKGGYGNSIVSGLLGGRKGKPRRLKNKAIQIVVKKSASLTEEESKKRNGQELEKIGIYERELSAFCSAMDGQPSMEKMMLAILKEVREARREYVTFAKKVYGNDLSSLVPHQYKETELATMYVDCVVDKGVAEPSQIQLKEHSKISQSTWSRAFQSLMFWKEVDARIENVWNAKDFVTRNIDSISRKKIDSKEIKDADTAEDRLKISELATIDERDLITAKIDSDRFKEWDKRKLMKAIIRLRPEAKMEDLEQCSEEQLRIILTLIS